MWRTATTILTLLMTGQYAMAAPLACLIEADKVAEIGSQSVGVIEKVNVERGDLVEAGQVLASLQAEVERASVSVAAVRAQAEADLKAAMAAQELMQRKVVRARELFGKKFVSQEAVDQAEAEARIASNRVAQAQEAQRVAQQELALTNTQLAQRSIRSPFSGVVTDRYRTEGERIEREPILRIAKVDPLRVEVIMPAAEFGQIRSGAAVSVNTDIPGIKDLKAKVTLVDRVIDAASNTFRVRLSLPNPDRRIPAGLRCKADFGSAPVAYFDSTEQSRPRMIKVSARPELEPQSEAAPGMALKLTRPSFATERSKK
ncbi:MAG TPA: efflux RND transporter periplasmic adaptor subunit [Burkholderiales bacterium]|nr:efflux RND transporter periplasmic adaptor subunit [Burkholderiales bacterium]